jgi:hypothetical protein
MAHRKSDDLFFTTLEQLHGQAPLELLNTLRAQLQLIKQTNPNSAQTAEACLRGLVSDRSTLLHVLTAAYLINGGVMLKHQLSADAAEEDFTTDRRDLDSELGDLEDELDKFSLSFSNDATTNPKHPTTTTKPHPQSLQAPPPQHPAPPQPSQ